MKICPNCQQEMDDSFATCENCGYDLTDIVGDIESEGAYEELPEEFPEMIEETSELESSYIEPDHYGDYQTEMSYDEQPLPQPEEEPELDIPEMPEVEEVEPAPEEPQRPLRRTPSAFGARTPGSMARPVHPRSTPTRAATAARRSTPAGVNARRKAEEEEREKNAQKEEPRSYSSAFVPSSDAQSSMAEETNHFAPEASAESDTSSGSASPMGHRTPSIQQRLTNRNHPEWNLDSASSKESEDKFKPVPPFISAEEADRPSPFAPAKTPVTSDKSADVPRGKASLDVATNPARRLDTSSDSGEISVSVRICPSCRSRCFSSEKTCKTCGYRFPKAGGIASLSAKSANILAMLAALSMAISVFTNIMTYKVNGVKTELRLIDSYHGFGFLALAALTMVFAFSGKNVAVIIVGLLSAIAAAAELYYRWYDITQVKKYGNVDNEIGIWLLGAGAVLIFVAGIYGMIKEKKKLEQYTSDYMNSI